VTRSRKARSRSFMVPRLETLMRISRETLLRARLSIRVGGVS